VAASNWGADRSFGTTPDVAALLLTMVMTEFKHALSERALEVALHIHQPALHGGQFDTVFKILRNEEVQLRFVFLQLVGRMNPKPQKATKSIQGPALSNPSNPSTSAPQPSASPLTPSAAVSSPSSSVGSPSSVAQPEIPKHYIPLGDRSDVFESLSQRFKGWKKEVRTIQEARVAEDRRREREMQRRKEAARREREKLKKLQEKERQDLVRQGVIGPDDPWPPRESYRGRGRGHLAGRGGGDRVLNFRQPRTSEEERLARDQKDAADKFLGRK